MTAFPKAAVRERRLSGDLNVRLWPKADIQIPGFLGVERKFGSERSRIA